MAVITITRNAMCKDCSFCQYFCVGKRKRHKCTNALSERYEQTITLKDLVCDKWKL